MNDNLSQFYEEEKLENGDIFRGGNFIIVAILDMSKFMVLPQNRAMELLFKNHPAKVWVSGWKATGFSIMKIRDFGTNNPKNVTAYLIRDPNEATRKRVDDWLETFPEYKPPEVSSLAELKHFYQLITGDRR